MIRCKETIKLLNVIFSQRKYQITLSILLIAIITFISFSNSLNNGFVWDDGRFVTENLLIRSLSWENIKIIFTSFYKEVFHQPLVLLSFSLEYYFFQLNPFIYHLDNLALHIFNSLLVYYFIFFLSKKASIALIIGLFFGVHPLHVESVTWVSERKDVLSTFFFLQAVIFYLYYKERKKGFYYCISLIIFIFSLLSKAMAVTLPLVLLLCDYHECRNFNRKTLLEKAPYFAISGIFGVINLFIHHSAGAMTSSNVLSLTDNLLIASRNVTFYLLKILLPTNLSAIYPYPGVISIFEPEFFFSIILLSILVIAVFFSIKYTRKVIFGSLFFLITILPVLKLIHFGGGGAATADRYMYIPSIGLFYIAGVTFYKAYIGEGAFKKIRRILIILFLCITMSTLSSLTYQRNKVWKDGETLWVNVIEKYPGVPIAHYNLGTEFYNKGLLDHAITEFKEAIRIAPNYIDAHYNLGAVYQNAGLPEKAIAEYKMVLRLNPNSADVYYNIGLIYTQLDSMDEAILAFQEALRIKPDYKEALQEMEKTRHLKQLQK